MEKYILSKKGRKIVDHTGRKTGTLTALYPSGKKDDGSNGVGYWLFQCECGNTKNYSAGNVFPTIKKEGKRYVRTCGCKMNMKMPSGANHGSYKGYEQITGAVYNRYRQNAKNRNIDFNITIEEMWNQYVLQNGLCRFTNLPITLTARNRDKSIIKDTASLDRIDSSKSYSKDNVQWVHKNVNRMKMSMSDSEFIHWCKLISDNN